MNDPPARAMLREIVADATAKEADRLKAIDLLRQVRDPRCEGIVPRTDPAGEVGRR